MYLEKASIFKLEIRMWALIVGDIWNHWCDRLWTTCDELCECPIAELFVIAGSENISEKIQVYPQSV